MQNYPYLKCSKQPNFKISSIYPAITPCSPENSNPTINSTTLSNTLKNNYPSVSQSSAITISPTTVTSKLCYLYWSKSTKIIGLYFLMICHRMILLIVLFSIWGVWGLIGLRMWEIWRESMRLIIYLMQGLISVGRIRYRCC